MNYHPDLGDRKTDAVLSNVRSKRRPVQGEPRKILPVLPVCCLQGPCEAGSETPRARLALVVAVLGILSVLVVRGAALLWQRPEILNASESRSFPLHYHSPSPDVVRSPYPPRSRSI